jgi:hypothetical protein
MLSLPLLLATTALASSAPSLGLALAAEAGLDGPDLALDFQNTALVARGERTLVTFLPMRVSWDFMDEQARPETFDRLELGLLGTERAVEDGRLLVSLTVLSASHDHDLGVIDATALGGEVSMFVYEQLVSVGMGLDVRYRAHTNGDLLHSFSILHHQAVVGIPVHVRAVTPSDLPWFVDGSLVVRPSPVAWGGGSFFVDSKARIVGGYQVFDGEDVDIRAQGILDWIRDGDAYPWLVSANQRGAFSELTWRGGMALVF